MIKWSNIQIGAFDQNISNQTFINNLANGRINGFEGDITARPTNVLTLNAGFSYNDTKLTSCVNSPIAQLLCSQGVLVPIGSPLALSPKFQGNVRFRYEWETSSGLKPFIQAGLHYVGSTISSDVANTNILYTGCRSPYSVCGQTSTINGVVVKVGDPIQLQPSSFKQPSYTTVEASLGVSKDDWSLQVYIDNIGDARPQLFTSANDGEIRVTTTRPRTIGMRFSYSM
jgi:outer membrane receptor protein involved in Fe transport